MHGRDKGDPVQTSFKLLVYWSENGQYAQNIALRTERGISVFKVSAWREEASVSHMQEPNVTDELMMNNE